MDNIVESYLVSLGYKLDAASEAKVKESISGFDKSVAESSGNIGKSLGKVQDVLVKSVGKGLGLSKSEIGLFSSSVGRAEKLTSGYVKELVGFQVGVTSVFAGITTGFLSLADHVANADLQLQINASRMMMSLPVARQFTSAMDALGASFDDIAASPELQQRLRSLMADSSNMEKSFGPEYEDQLKKIRDIRFEFTRMKQELTYLSMGVVSKVFKDLGLGPDEANAKLKQFADYIEQHIPEISAAISRDLVPILQGTAHTFGELKDMGVEGLGVFQHLVGIFSGDSGLKDGPVTFDSISKSVEHLIHGVDDLIDSLTDAEKFMMNLAEGAADFATGDFKGAGSKLKSALSNIHPGSGAVIGSVVGGGGGALGGAVAGGLLGAEIGTFVGPIGTVVGGAAGTAIGGIGGFLGGGAVGASAGYNLGQLHDEITGGSSRDVSRFLHAGDLTGQRIGDHIGNQVDVIKDQIAAQSYSVAKAMGIDAVELRALSMRVASVESSYQQYDKDGNVLRSTDPHSHATGVFQLEPATSKQLGVDATDTAQNIHGGIELIADLLKHYGGDVRHAIEAYYIGQNAEDRTLIAGVEDKDARVYADKVLGRNEVAASASQYQAAPYSDAYRYQDQVAQPGSTSRTVNVGDVNVHVTQPGASAHEIGQQVNEALLQQTAYSLMQTQGVY